MFGQPSQNYSELDWRSSRRTLSHDSTNGESDSGTAVTDPISSTGTSKDNVKPGVKRVNTDFSLFSPTSWRPGPPSSPTQLSQQWWKPVLWMSLLIALALVAGIAQHLSFSKLDGESVETIPQAWAHNIGTAIGFVLKTSLTLAVALAFQEALWYSVRKRAIRISTLDDLFVLLGNPLGFTIDSARSAPIAVILAGVAWIIPLSVILSPGTLTVQYSQISSARSCTVPGLPANASYLYTVTPHSSAYNGPSRALQKLASQTLPGGSIVGFSSPCGSNCTFSEKFFGPALDCYEQPNPDYLSIGTTMYSFKFNATDVSPPGNGNTTINMTITWLNSTPSDPISVANASRVKTMMCSPYNATYHLNITYSNDAPTYDVKLTNNGPIFGLPWGTAVYEGLPSNSSLNVQANWVSLVKAVFNDYLNGEWTQAPTSIYALPSTKIDQTALAGAVNFHAGDLWQINQDLITGVPDLLTNLTLSTMSINASNITTECTAHETIQSYSYAPLWLILPYSIAIVLGLLSLLCATFLLRAVGVRTGNMFSQILVTTRNAQLDELTIGNSLSSAGAAALKKEKLRLGELRTVGSVEDISYSPIQEGTGRAAFGRPEHVLKIERSRTYR